MLCLLVKCAPIKRLGQAVHLAQGGKLSVQLLELIAHLRDPRHGANFGFDDDGANWFDQIVIAPGLDSFSVAVVLALSGQKDDRNPVPTQPLAKDRKSTRLNSSHVAI